VGTTRVALLAMASLALLVGCEEPKGPRGTAKNPWIVGMSQCNRGEPWRVQMDKDVGDAAARRPELKVAFKDAANDSIVQQGQVREFIQQGVDLIIISPKEAKPLTQPVAEAMEAGVPVIVLDRKVEGDKYTCFIGADNVKIGAAAGKYMVNLLDRKGKVVELKGLMTSTPGQERHDGFMQGIKGSEIEIIFDADCQWLEPNAKKEMTSALQRFDRIDAVYAHNDPSAHGAFLAAKEEAKGRDRRIKFIGIDALPHEGVQYVRDGIMTATFEYPTGGKRAIEVALQILRGEKDIPKNITLGTRLFTRENVETGGEAVE